MKKHFIRMMTPCHFMSEDTHQEIDSLDIDKAKEIAMNFSQGYGKCYAFYLYTKERGKNDFEPKKTYTSPCYYIRGDILTLDDVRKKDGERSILYENMYCNKWERVMEVDGKCFPLKESDVFLN